jgi:hypothetical protein
VALSQTLGQLHAQLSDGTDKRVNVDLADFGSAQPDARNGQSPTGDGRGQTPRAQPAPVADYAPAGPGGIPDPVLTGGRTIDLRL